MLERFILIPCKEPLTVQTGCGRRCPEGSRFASIRGRPHHWRIDSSPENRRQKEFNNRGARVRRQGDRRSVEWLCRRDGRRLRVCWPAGGGGWGGGGSGYWRAGRTAVCGRRERAAQPEPLWG